MRRLLTSIVAAAATLVPVLALAENPNQQAAQQIAAHLTQSGQLKHFRIAVKFKDGTAWLQGQVCDEEQVKTALKLAYEPDFVLGVVNNLTVVPFEPVAPSPTKTASVAQPAPAAAAQPSGEKVSPPAENSEQSEGATKVPARPPKPMLAIFEPFRRPTHEATLPAEDPAQESQTGARRVSASFTAAPAQTVGAESAIGEPDITEPAPQPIISQPVASQSLLSRPVAPQPMAPQGTAAPMARYNGGQRPLPIALAQRTSLNDAPSAGVPGAPMPMYAPGVGGAPSPTRFDVPNMPNHAWPSYASYPNYAAVTYPRQYSATAWPYIGPFYPYPQVPLGWRKVTLQWDDGWWFLDFKDESGCCWWR